jgi:hypothetical protein
MTCIFIQVGLQIQLLVFKKLGWKDKGKTLTTTIIRRQGKVLKFESDFIFQLNILHVRSYLLKMNDKSID